MRNLISVLFLVSIFNPVFSQDKYFIYFTDKEGVEFDPFTYFDEKAIERRMREGLSLTDISDFPVKEEYIQTVTSICDSAKVVSRWMNGMSIYASEEQIKHIGSLPFVLEIEKMQHLEVEPLSISKEDDVEFKLELSQLDLIRFHTFRHQDSAFKANQLTGAGIRIAIFDVGFPNVDTHPAFKYVREHDRIKGTYNFVKNNEDVYYSMSHGTSVLSCIAGWYDSIPIGMAPDAEFLLAKTEMRHTEFASEEDNWLAAAEWADKNGADIISSSIGYGKERYYQTDMNGKKSIVSRAAKIACDKGILVVNAAGNEGDNLWETIVTPADVEEVLTVGGISPHSDVHIEFSSFGPTADGRMKPNVCSLGEVVCAGKNDYISMQGTSFATPLIAGFAACAWQSNRELTRADLFEAIEKSGHLYPYYDYAHGYGVPQATWFTADSIQEPDTTFTLNINNYDITINYVSDSTGIAGDEMSPKNFYYEFIDENGSIVYFAVLRSFSISDLFSTSMIFNFNFNFSNNIEIPYEVIGNRSRYSLRAHYEGYTATYKLISSEN